jgi:threonyl-tRNA synthetase
VAEVDGKLVDMTHTLSQSCLVSFHDFSSAVGRQTFWHSSAHLLGHALEQLHTTPSQTVLLCDGPALERGGFFYDCRIENNDTGFVQSAPLAFTHSDLNKLTSTMRWMSKQAFAFERLVVSRRLALQMFEYNHFKQTLIRSFAEHATISLYKCGPFIDLCAGPHVPATDYVCAKTRVVSVSGCLSVHHSHSLQHVKHMVCMCVC